jgi:hypothetical protein
MAVTTVLADSWAQNTVLATVPDSTASLGGTATAGNLLVALIAADAYLASTPTDWTLLLDEETFVGVYLLYKVAVGDEVGITYDLGAAVPSCGCIAEFAGTTGALVGTAASQHQTSTVGSYTTPGIVPPAGEAFLIGALGASWAGDSISVTNWLNSFTELADATTTLGSGTRDGAALATRTVTGDGTTSFSTGADFINSENLTNAQVGMIAGFGVASEEPGISLGSAVTIAAAIAAPAISAGGSANPGPVTMTAMSTPPTVGGSAPTEGNLTVVAANNWLPYLADAGAQLEAAWGAQPTPGSLLLAAVNSSQQVDVTAMEAAGWELAPNLSTLANSALYLFHKLAGPSEPSVTIPLIGGTWPIAAAIAEYSAPASIPFDVGAAGAPRVFNSFDALAAGPAGVSSQNHTLVVFVVGSIQATGADVRWGGHTNDLIEQVDIGTSATERVGVMVATRQVDAVGAFEGAATPSSSTAGAAIIGVFRAGTGSESALVIPPTATITTTLGTPAVAKQVQLTTPVTVTCTPQPLEGTTDTYPEPAALTITAGLGAPVLPSGAEAINATVAGLAGVAVHAVIGSTVVTGGAIPAPPAPVTVTAAIGPPALATGQIAAPTPVAVTAALAAPPVRINETATAPLITIHAAIGSTTVHASGTAAVAAPVTVHASLSAPPVMVTAPLTPGPTHITTILAGPIISFGGTATPGPVGIHATIAATVVAATVVTAPAGVTVHAAVGAPSVSAGGRFAAQPVTIHAALTARPPATTLAPPLTAVVIHAGLPGAHVAAAVALRPARIEVHAAVGAPTMSAGGRFAAPPVRIAAALAAPAAIVAGTPHPAGIAITTTVGPATVRTVVRLQIGSVAITATLTASAMAITGRARPAGVTIHAALGLVDIEGVDPLYYGALYGVLVASTAYRRCRGVLIT